MGWLTEGWITVTLGGLDGDLCPNAGLFRCAFSESDFLGEIGEGLLSDRRSDKAGLPRGLSEWSRAGEWSLWMVASPVLSLCAL